MDGEVVQAVLEVRSMVEMEEEQESISKVKRLQLQELQIRDSGSASR